MYSQAAYAVGTDVASGALPRLRGYRLLLARAAWVAVTLISLGIFAASVPVQFAARQALCAGDACLDGHFGPELAQGLHELGLSVAAYATYIVALDTIFVLGFIIIGAVIFWRKPDEPMALFVAFALVMFGATWPTIPAMLTEAHYGWASFAQFWKLLGMYAFFLFFYVFPDGRFVPRWTRGPAVMLLGVLVLGTLLRGSFLDPDTWPWQVELPIELSVFGSLVFAQIYRYRCISGPIQRQQTKWVIFGVTLTIAGGAAFLSLGELFPMLSQPGRAYVIFDLIGRTVFGALTLLLIPLAIGVAILRYRLWDIDLIINRTLVYGALSASVAGIYVIVVGSLGALFQSRGDLAISLIATALVALLFQPLRDRLQRGINRLMYGERDDPYAVLSRLGQRLDATLAPESILPTIVETVREALKLPYVAIALKQNDEMMIVAEATNQETGGRRDKQTAVLREATSRTAMLPYCLALSYQGETIGQLMLSPRAPGEAFSAADQRLLDDLARQAGAAAHAVRLTADLQHSRERLVTAREEERRRLRRDLHDGLGSTLAGLNLQAGALRLMIPRDPAAADELVVDLRSGIRAAIADIRRLAYELRPPALDELGLVGAIRARATQYQHSGDTDRLSLRVIVEAPEHMPSLPAAIEVAAYRIVQEALTNMLRHAQACTGVIRLALEDGFRLEIRDDGIGLPSERVAGVGLLSMAERAAELGGTCVVEPAPGGGTRVLVWLPLESAERRVEDRMSVVESPHALLRERTNYGVPSLWT